jgi:hypothetical protein
VTDPTKTLEAMVTAVITEDAAGQAFLLSDLTAGEEAYCRAGASLIASVYVAIAQRSGQSPIDLWARQMEFVNGRRQGRG